MHACGVEIDDWGNAMMRGSKKDTYTVTHTHTHTHAHTYTNARPKLTILQ